ncbi:MAG: hybrid sensor histidine kinase/response regulator [Ahrensia sp.]|nr:hybrid sensor histidine kinase/response regulator [Ahrensia sp.]
MIAGVQKCDASAVCSGRIAVALQVASALLLAVLIGLFALLYQNQNTLRDSVREDAIWGVYQLDRETRKLGASLHNYINDPATGAKALDQIGLRYDILYSRLNVLENAKYQDYFTDNPEVVARIRDTRRQILAMEPVFNRIAEGGEPIREALLEIEAGFPELVNSTEDFLTFTNATVSRQRAESRERLITIERVTAGLVAGLFFVMIVLVFALRRQAYSARALADRAAHVSEELSRSWAAAEAGNRAKSQFMATIGHEIRTPLNAILGMAELLDAEDLPAESAECVQVIHSSGSTLLEMLTEILDYSKIEHGKLEIEYQPVALSALVDGALDIVRGRAHEKDLVLRADVSESLTRSLYRTDPTRVRQVLINLLGNAVKFTDAGEIRLTVRMQDRLGRQSLRFEIRDTGIGIDAEGREKLFEPFSQVDSSISRGFGGTGLGLTICKHIVEALGGRIAMRPNRDGGSTFWFDIPVEQVAGMPAQEPVTAIAEHAPMLPQVKTLLVEDNSFNNRVATRFLARLGQTATIAVNGLEAVDIASREKFDLILMDIQMPLMDGIEAVRRIRSGTGPNARTTVVAMTANASEEDRRRCFEVGFDGFESKPMTMDRLRAVFGRVVDGKQMPGEAVEPQFGGRVNPARQAEMIDLFGEDEYRELVSAFLREAEGLVSALEQPGSADAETRDRLLHTLKGAALNVGLDDIAAAATALRAQPSAPGDAEKLRACCTAARPLEDAA